MLQLLAALAVSVGLSGEEGMVCFDKYVNVGGASGVCVLTALAAVTPLGRFSAEHYCALQGAHLAKLAKESVLNDLPAKDGLQGDWHYWTGLRLVRGRWQWADGTTNVSALASLGLLPAVPDAWNGNDALCASIERKAGVLGMHLLSCGTELPPMCTAGHEGCIWENQEVGLSGVSLGKPAVATFTVSILPNGVFLVDGEEAGMGSWVTPNAFEVVNPNFVSCRWRGVFDTATGTAQTGCLRTAGSAEFDLATVSTAPVIYSMCTRPKTPSQNCANAGSPAAHPGGGTPRVSYLLEEDLENLPPSDPPPVWVWPVAFLLVAVASAAAALGVASRRRAHSPGSGAKALMDGRQIEQEPDIPVTLPSVRAATPKAQSDDSSAEQGETEGELDLQAATGSSTETPEALAAAACDICSKFNETAARARLIAVHRALAEELKNPLVINSTQCLHSKGEHVHFFSVANEFHAHTLGALSTVYSRTKPRLPRNTRIHVQLSTPQVEGADFAADRDYIAAAYY
ncbi:hypothetical protein DIPPA_08912 [Diplonema papillatum]|nr:hypothetical protein DIPPA_08912 [Diplonema papillatum]